MEQAASENVPKTNGEVKGGQEEQPKHVSLDLDTYNALLDRIAELETISSQKTGKRSAGEEPIDLEQLAREGRQGKVEKVEKGERVDLNAFDNQQLVEHVLDKIDQLAGPRIQQIETAVETLRVMREIDKAESKYEDFWDFEEKIREISTKNPTLSIDQAYKLAKGDSTEKKEKKGEEKTVTTTTEKLLKLPPRVIPGEKPTGLAPGATKSGPAKTLRGSVEKAWDAVVGKDKTEL